MMQVFFLEKLSQRRQAHLVTHGKFTRTDPRASYLTLESNKGIHLPLWICAGDL
jgi:CHAT domain-containing protein